MAILAEGRRVGDDFRAVSPCLPDSKLAAALIVRNEEANLGECLQSLVGSVDCVHVRDTGSVDRSIEIAAELGVQITHGKWVNDFAEARNAVLDQVSAMWTLSIDADERLVVGDQKQLLDILENTDRSAFEIEIDNLQDESVYTHRAIRLFRTRAAMWQGKVHEQLVGRDGLLSVAVLSRSVVYLHHGGYRDQAIRHAKSERNIELARFGVTELNQSGDHNAQAYALLDLARSYLGADQRNEAMATFEEVRSRYPQSPQWTEATDFLTRSLLAIGEDRHALVLIDELRRVGASKSYCDWLAAQALIQLGQIDEAATLLDQVQEVVDTSGRRHDSELLRQLKEIVSKLQN